MKSIFTFLLLCIVSSVTGQSDHPLTDTIRLNVCEGDCVTIGKDLDSTFDYRWPVQFSYAPSFVEGKPVQYICVDDLYYHFLNAEVFNNQGKYIKTIVFQFIIKPISISVRIDQEMLNKGDSTEIMVDYGAFRLEDLSEIVYHTKYTWSDVNGKIVGAKVGIKVAEPGIYTVTVTNRFCSKTATGTVFAAEKGIAPNTGDINPTTRELLFKIKIPEKITGYYHIVPFELSFENIGKSDYRIARQVIPFHTPYQLDFQLPGDSIWQFCKTIRNEAPPYRGGRFTDYNAKTRPFQILPKASDYYAGHIDGFLHDASPAFLSAIKKLSDQDSLTVHFRLRRYILSRDLTTQSDPRTISFVSNNVQTVFYRYSGDSLTNALVQYIDGTPYPTLLSVINRYLFYGQYSFEVLNIGDWYTPKKPYFDTIVAQYSSSRLADKICYFYGLATLDQLKKSIEKHPDPTTQIPEIERIKNLFIHLLSLDDLFMEDLVENQGSQALDDAIRAICTYWVGPPKPAITGKEDFYKYFYNDGRWDIYSCPVWGFKKELEDFGRR